MLRVTTVAAGAVMGIAAIGGTPAVDPIGAPTGRPAEGNIGTIGELAVDPAAGSTRDVRRSVIGALFGTAIAPIPGSATMGNVIVGSAMVRPGIDIMEDTPTAATPAAPASGATMPAGGPDTAIIPLDMRGCVRRWAASWWACPSGAPASISADPSIIT